MSYFLDGQTNVHHNIDKQYMILYEAALVSRKNKAKFKNYGEVLCV